VRLRIALGAALASAVAVAVFASAGGSRSTVSAECSRAAALRVGKPYFWDAKYTVAQLLCGQFTGPGSDAMVVAFAAPTCWPLQGWAVFTFSGGDWRRVLLRRGVFVYPLKVVGGDIRETEPVPRAGDARCTCRASGLDHNAHRISLAATGRTPYPRACSGDAGPFIGQSTARVLAYGKTWRRAGISCRSAFTGMTCRNRSGHGFFLSRARWRRF
jgi:hypothetical protein